jgi:energy-coupling factor transporter ATP-binding protein EcfA2
MGIKVIKSLSIKNFLGIIEKTFEPGKINIISGKKGAGKTTIIEAIEYALTGKLNSKEARGDLPKTELVRHGERESVLYVELNDGLAVDRRIRAESSDYLKVSKPGQAVPQTESFLRSFIKGDIFRPGEFLKKSPEEQAAIILDMLEINWTMDDIRNWFGEKPEGINFDMHILKILKQIEKKYYDDRTAINQQIDVLKVQAQGYKNQMPANYDGEEWRNKSVQEYYSKVTQAEEVNKKIDAAKAAIEGLQNRIATIRANAETDKQTRKNAFDRQRSDSRELIGFLNQKIESAQKVINDVETRIIESDKSLDNELAAEIEKLKGKYAQLKVEAKDIICLEATGAQTSISNYKNSVSAKEQELLNIDELEKQALQSIDEKTEEQVKTADAEAGNSKKILEEAKSIENIDIGESGEALGINIQPLQKAAEEVTTMREYLRDFDLMKDILISKLAPKEELSKALTAKIEKARSLPLELLKVSKCPIDGVAVDGEGMLRINGTLINGLSDGEKKDLTMKIAKARAEAGDLKIICFDGFQDLDDDAQRQYIEDAKKDGYMWFFLKTESGDLNIEIIDSE